MTKFLWHMDGHNWHKIIERVEEDREKRPLSIKDVHKRFLHKLGDMVRKRGFLSPLGTNKKAT